LTSEYETGAVRTEGGDNTGGRTRGAGGGGLDEEMRQKFETVKAKLARYKQLKRELDEVAAEATTLASTEEILRERLSLVSGDVAEEERRAGVTGFAAASETLEEVSRAKASVDERKGEALEEISAFIQEINKKVNERKGKLAPQIKRLREARASHAELEARHAEKKAAYDATAATHRSTYDALEREVNRMKSRMKSDEGRFRLADVEAALVDAHVRRITNGRDAASVKATYVARVEAAEAEAKRLKQRQKEVKDAADGGVDAMEMMKDLHRLMTIKLSAARRLMGETRGSESVTNTGANVLSM
jgi:intraflagellar transport protein 81